MMASALSFFLFTVFALQAAWAAKTNCLAKKADIVIIMDESTSIRREAFVDQKTFLSKLIDNFDIKADRTRVGLISFSTSPRTQFDMKTFINDKQKMRNRVSNVKQRTGNTYTWLALDMARERGFTNWAGSRINDKTIPKIAIVITDGNSQEPEKTMAAAKKLRNHGVSVYAIGVGREKYISQRELLAIAGEDSHVFRVQSYDKLKYIESRILGVACVTDAPPTLHIYGTCRDKKADVLFVMDTSENAMAEQVEGMKSYLANLVYSLDIGADKTRVGLITYSTTANLQFGFNKFNTHQDVYQSVMSVKADLAPVANLKHALKLANEQSFNPDKGGRTKIAKALVLITTGKSSDSAQSVQMARRLMADRGVRIIAIALADASKKELSSIAGADGIIPVADVKGLPAVRDRVAAKICRSKPPPNDFACGELRGIDLAFVMNTQSAGGHDMVYASEFMQKASDKFEIGPGKVQVSVVPAQCKTLPGFKLNRYPTKPKLIQGLKLERQESLGNLMTQVTTTTFTNANGARPKSHVTRAIVIVTDGTPDQASIQKAQQAKADGTKVFVVGVGKKVNSKSLAQMASEPAGTHVYSARTYEELVSDPKIVDGITTSICQSSA